ncbi:MAG: hypothetical protein EOP86_04170 [Verrucomicrobiaceae bacterium]|nr:MAG: hypothetical protein EOP86_04170 [Verrucomicrobiaceae bacterium]
MNIPKLLSPPLLAAAIGLSAPVAAQAGTAPAPAAPPPVMTPPQSDPWAHVLLQLDFSDHYITPRGLNVENKGLVFQPLLLVFWDLYSNESGFLKDVSLTTGVWSSIHSEKSGADPGHWNEFDPILGLTFKFAGNWKLDTTFTQFESMVDSYPTSTHFEAKVSYDDSSLWGSVFSMNPFVAYWQELDEKATVVFNNATSDQSYYFTLGINPTIKLDAVKLEFPTYVNLVGSDFYQKFDGTGGGSGLAVFSTGLKASVPLKFIPKSAGFWSLYAGVKYYHLENEGLLDGNMVLTPEEHKKDLVQFSGGLSIFF